MFTIEIYNKKDGEKIHLFDGTSEPTYIGEVLNIEYNDKDTDFCVVWCSTPENGYQKAIVEQI